MKKFIEFSKKSLHTYLSCIKTKVAIKKKKKKIRPRICLSLKVLSSVYKICYFQNKININILT